ncbi:MAG: M1 family metallopeptidase [Pyrinomonadaceae bacterium]
MNPKIKLITFALVMCFSNALLAQDEPKTNDKRILAEVTVTSKEANADPVYQELRNLSEDKSSFGGKYAEVKDLVLKKDQAQFTLKSGEIYFLKEAEGKRTGAVFLGDGKFTMQPPNLVEANMLRVFTDKTSVDEEFNELVMFFTDDTFEAIEKSPNVVIKENGSQASKARDAYRAKEEALKSKPLEFNMSTRKLIDFYSVQRDGFFWGFINGKHYHDLIYILDPLGAPEMAPEQVVLLNSNPAELATWISTHRYKELLDGTGNSNVDRSLYDIKHHDIDVAIRGTKLIVTDEVELALRVKGQRVLPMNLNPNLRVKRVSDQNGAEVGFIQEDKKKDSDLAVILKEAPPVGKNFKLTFEYDGENAFESMGKGNFILIARTNWYPNNIGSRFLDRASFDIRYIFPKEYVMVGVGEQVGEKVLDERFKESEWSTKGVEMATAGFNFGDFREQQITDQVTGYKLEVYNNRELPEEIKAYLLQLDEFQRRNSENGGGVVTSNVRGTTTASMAKTVLDETLNSVRIYDTYFGKLPFNRIAMTEQPVYYFGQSWATLIFMPYMAFISDVQRKDFFGLRSAKNAFWREVGPHEVAHQWWGHAVGWTSYRDQWMSEGFAEFSASLYVQLVNSDENKFIEYWNAQRDKILNSSASTNGKAPYKVGPIIMGYRLNTPKTGRIAQNLIYPKGAYVLHMLRMMMINPRGKTIQEKDARFIAMMHDFIKSHYDKDVSTEDFKRIVEKHITPEMDLYKNGSMDWFFNEWVYGTEMPKYDFEYSVSNSGGKTLLSGKLTQSEVSDYFVMPVPIYVDYGKGWVELGKMTMVGNQAKELSNIELAKKPKRVAVAALNDVLASRISNKER